MVKFGTRYSSIDLPAIIVASQFTIISFILNDLVALVFPKKLSWTWLLTVVSSIPSDLVARVFFEKLRRTDCFNGPQELMDGSFNLLPA